MHNFFRKLSIRKKSQPDGGVQKKKSSGGLLRFIRSDHQKEEQALFDMPTPLVLEIIDRMSFYEQLRLSRLSTDVKNHLEQKWSQVKKLELRKKDIDVTCEDKHFQRHHKAYVAIKIENETATIVIDEAWVVNDLYAFLAILEVFRSSIETVEMDSPIAELIVIYLSDISLERWYAFQCILKAFKEMYSDLHLDSPFIADRDCFWPKVSDITIHSTKDQVAGLGRILDYGVKSGYVFQRKVMDHLKLEVSDLEGYTDKDAKMSIYYFRCWAGSLGWDHRYEIVFGQRKENQVCQV